MQDTNALTETAIDEFEAGFTGEEAQEEREETIPETPAEPVEEETEGDTKPEEEAETEPQTEEKPAEAIEVTFLGEKMTVPLSEAPAYIQKGLNYDHLQGKLTKLEAQLSSTQGERAIISQMERYARANGATLADMVAQMKSFSDAKGVAETKTEAPDYFAQKAKEDWKAFMKAYPDITDPKNQLPQEVWQKISEGLTPRQALIEYKSSDFDRKMSEKDAEIERLKTEIETYKKNEQTRAKAPGSASSSGKNMADDDFLAGFSVGW